MMRAVLKMNLNVLAIDPVCQPHTDDDNSINSSPKQKGVFSTTSNSIYLTRNTITILD